MKPLNRPQRYAVQRIYRWSPYLRGKMRVLMPFEVRRALRIQQERNARALESMRAQVAALVETAKCDDPECETCHPKVSLQ